MTSKRSKHKKSTSKDFLGSSPSTSTKGMSSSYYPSNPPTGPRATLGNPYKTSPPRGPRRDDRDDSREGDWRRSRSRSRSPRRADSPRRRENRSGSRDRNRDGRRFPYDNNYRPRRYSRSPVRPTAKRPPLEHRTESNRSSITKSPVEERGKHIKLSAASAFIPNSHNIHYFMTHRLSTKLKINTYSSRPQMMSS